MALDLLNCHQEALERRNITVRNSFHFCSRSAIAALAVSVCFGQVLTAQVSSSGKRPHFIRTSAGSKSTYRTKTQRSIAEVLAPNTPELRQPATPLSLAAQPSESYRSPVNLKLLLPQSQTISGAAENDREPVAHVQSSEFAEASASPEPNSHSDDLQYYARHVPVVGGLMQHVFQQSKAHPHVTRVLQYIHPEF